ncbi:hypothetical protein Q5P01_015522 [Channa striata]|uniref:Uncharacterized protein n=1 Tax=Channa striata TaxID=64152 RepID=A0AA88MCG3_CHASR|nr:hypothetical protein Q5P01_015522 [Channa striata]
MGALTKRRQMWTKAAAGTLFRFLLMIYTKHVDESQQMGPEVRGQRQKPGMNLPGHVEPCQSEAQLAIHHPALAACHCRHGFFYCVCVCVCVCVCKRERDGCSPAVRAPHHHHVHLHPPRTSSKEREEAFRSPRSDSSPRTHGWMEGIETGSEGEANGGEGPNYPRMQQ